MGNFQLKEHLKYLLMRYDILIRCQLQWKIKSCKLPDGKRQYVYFHEEVSLVNVVLG